MKKILLLYLSLCFLISGPAFAGRFNVIRYECGEFAQNGEMIRCAVVSNQGQAELLIRVLPGALSAKNKKRSLYLVDRTIYKFQAMGGRFYTMRKINEEGEAVEITCSPGKGRRFGSICHDWHPVEGDDVFKWP